MAAPIQYERRTFENGLIESVSEYVNPNSFRGATETWLVPGYEGVLGDFGPQVTKDSDSGTPIPKILSGVVGKDSSGNVLRVVQDIGAVSPSVRKLNADGTIGSALKTGVSATQPMSFVVYNDKILCFDGATTPFQIVISSEAVSDIGLTRPDSTAGGGITTSLTGGGSGNVKGIVKYYIAEITGTTPNIVESALSLAFGQIDAGDGDQVTITFPNHSAFNSRTFYIYRTYRDQIDPNYLAEVSVGASGGTYVDDIPDAELGGLPRYHGDQPPSDIIAAAVYNDVVYGLTKDKLYMSDPEQEESWWTVTDGGYVSVDKGDGDVGTALFVESDGVVVFKERHIYKLLGTAPENQSLIPIVSADSRTASLGTPTINSITGVPGGAFFYFENGFYLYSNGQVRRVSERIDRMFFGSGTYSANSSAVVEYDPRFGTVYCGIEARLQGRPVFGTAGGTILVFDIAAGRWRGVGAVTSYDTNSMMYDQEQGIMFGFFQGFAAPNPLYLCASLVDGQDLETVLNTDVFSTNDASFQVPRVIGSSPSLEKQFLWAEIQAEGPSGGGTVTGRWAIDGGSFSSGDSDTLASGRAKYRFNIGERGREMDLELTFNKGFRVFDVVVAFQEFGPRSF